MSGSHFFQQCLGPTHNKMSIKQNRNKMSIKSNHSALYFSNDAFKVCSKFT
jgi:hypothetical protein